MKQPDQGATAPFSGPESADAGALQPVKVDLPAGVAVVPQPMVGAPPPDEGQAVQARNGAGHSGEGPKPNRKRKRRRGRKAVQVPVAPASRQTATPKPLGMEAPPVAPKRPAPDGHPQAHTVQRNLPLYAALDLGTNNCRLLVAMPTRPGQFRVVDAFSRIVRLGEGLGANGRLSQGAMDRAVEALKICGDKLQARPVKKMRLIATEACRSADNGREFLARVHEETGLSLEIVDRETEARLAVSGCASLVDREAKSVVLFDIGGGSSEIALVDVEERRRGSLADSIVAWTSLPVGVVTMAEKFGGRDVTQELFAAMVSHATKLLEDNASDRLLASTGPDGGRHLIGTSGTVTTLAGIHLDLPRYDRRRVDGLWMQSDDVDAITGRLLSWSFEERTANACIGADRADLVLAGCAILEAIRRAWPAERLRVADRGLREGLLTDMMAQDGVWRRRRSRKWRRP